MKIVTDSKILRYCGTVDTTAMGDSEVEHWMGSECGITTFVRGILPHPPYTSPQRGTPVFCDPGGDDGPVDNSRLKRKSSFSQDSCESDGSDSEILPSNKRQRITLSAIRQLFAQFSLNDPEETTVSLPASTNDPQNVSNQDTELDIPHTSDNSKNKLKPTSEFDTLDSTVEKKTDSSNTNDKVVKRTSTSEESHVQNGKRQKVSNDTKADDEEDEDDQKGEERHQTKTSKSRRPTEVIVGNEDESEDATSNEAVKANKRQVEVNDSDTEGTGENSNKVKRTRRLRRGLRLCTNITCYIEQVLYN